MKALRTLVLGTFLSFPFLLFGQLELKLQLMPDSNTWGVYVKPDSAIPFISPNAYTASGQVTVVMPEDFLWQGITNTHGHWEANAYVIGPVEAPHKQYVSFAMSSNNPPIKYFPGQETLLFTFGNAGTECPDTMYIIDCYTPNPTDPFCPDPTNSANSSPGCDLSVIDITSSGTYFYNFSGIYDQSAWNCHPAPPVPDPEGLALSLKWLPGSEEWGVYVKPVGSISPSPNAYTATGQVTVVCPADFTFTDLKSTSGLWENNATVVSPSENPNMRYVSFGLTEAGNLGYQVGEETLLFTFKNAGNECPDTLYLIDCNTPTAADPFCPDVTGGTGGYINSNPGNDLSSIDILPGSGTYFYNFVDIYDREAWNCENSIGGIDPGGINYAEDIKMKIQLMPDETTWGVYVKVPPAVSQSDNAVVAASKVAIAAPLGFQYINLNSVEGEWEEMARKDAPTDAPNLTYLSFGQTFNNPALAFEDEETLLFTFERVGDCPDTLYLLDSPVSGQGQSQGISLGNFSSGFSIISFGNSQITSYEYCCSYVPTAWNCNGNFTDNGPNDLKGGLPGTGSMHESTSFSVSPNPSKNFVQIGIANGHDNELLQLILLDLNGRRVLQQTTTSNGTVELDLSGLAEGIYMVAIEGNGKMLHREKLVVLK